MGRSGFVDPHRRRPALVRVVECDRPHEPSSRHLLDEVDVVELGRGEREVSRDGRRLILRVPDPHLSINHARLTRDGDAWSLEDTGSKNGCLVNGAPTRRGPLAAGDLLELGHTCFLFSHLAAAPEARADVTAAELPAPAPALRTFIASLERGFATLARIAQTPVAVIVRGETGTGKEIVARALHELSGRTGPFVTVPCSALPDELLDAALFGHRQGAVAGALADRAGYVRAADRGTLYLDDVGELPAESQLALLRVLQAQEVVAVGDVTPVKVDLRLVAASHQDLDGLVESGLFRRDLYARMFGLALELPPLRARREDLGTLVAAVLRRLPGGDRATFTPAAARALLRHDWPLNVRELERCLAAALALAGDQPIDAEHLPTAVRRTPAERAALAAATAASAPPPSELDGPLRDQLVELLTAHGGNVTAVSRALGKGRMQVHRWAKRFGLDLEAFRR